MCTPTTKPKLSVGKLRKIPKIRLFVDVYVNLKLSFIFITVEQRVVSITTKLQKVASSLPEVGKSEINEKSRLYI